MKTQKFDEHIYDLMMRRPLPRPDFKVGDVIVFRNILKCEFTRPTGETLPFIGVHISRAGSCHVCETSLRKFLCDENFELVPNALNVADFCSFLTEQQRFEIVSIEMPDSEDLYHSPNFWTAKKVVLRPV